MIFMTSTCTSVGIDTVLLIVLQNVHYNITCAVWLQVACASYANAMCSIQTVLAPKDVSLLERCPHFRGCYSMYSLQWSWDLKTCPYLRGVLISEGVTVCTVFNGVGT